MEKREGIEARFAETPKGAAPAFERRLKDVRVACWRNEQERDGQGPDGAQAKRIWYHVMLSRTYWTKDNEAREAAGSLNGLPDIALAIAALQAAQEFIERDSARLTVAA